MAGTTVSGGFTFTGSGFDPSAADRDPDILDRPAGLSQDIWDALKLIADREGKGQCNAAFGHAVSLVNQLAATHSYNGGAYE